MNGSNQGEYTLLLRWHHAHNMIKEVDALQYGTVKRHLSAQVCFNASHSESLCGANDTKDCIRSGRARIASLLGIQIDHTALFWYVE
jgi:hypothetical protein